MMQQRLARLREMSAAEISWRSRHAAKTALARAQYAARRPQWNRSALARILAPEEVPHLVGAASREQWMDVHRALLEYFARTPQRFLIAPRLQQTVAGRINQGWPDAAREARAHADDILSGRYDILGYRGLSFSLPSGEIDWHTDPVSGRRPPQTFWADVPFLDPAIGDHKVIWEINRHQHWLTFGRAFWLTGDARYREAVIDQLRSWLRANPPLLGINWASMLELAFRSLSWIWTINFFANERAADHSPWLVDLLVALDRQLDHLEGHLSYYFSPNTHLIGEALALYVAGRTLPLLEGSRRRAALGHRILVEEIGRQVAADGGHCERSTHYHRYTLDFYLLALVVARTTGDPVADTLAPAVYRLAAAARLLADDHGRLPHLGDDDGGMAMPVTRRFPDDVRDSLAVAGVLLNRFDLPIGRAPEEACWMLAEPGLSHRLDEHEARAAAAPLAVASRALPETGYYVSRGQGNHLVVDAGAHGFLNGGHAHADALSLALSVRGRALLIDPGTGSYTVDTTVRDRFRSSAFHNTLTVDGQPQSIPAGPFAWRHVANGRVHRWRSDASFDYLVASHDGYRPIEHRRHVLSVHGDLLIVADYVAGGAIDNVHAQWHIGPDWQTTTTDCTATFRCGGDHVTMGTSAGVLEMLRGDDPANLTELGWHAPIYGRVEPIATIRTRMVNPASPIWLIAVFSLNPANDVVAVDLLPRDVASATSPPVAVAITRSASVELFIIGPEWHGSDEDGPPAWCQNDLGAGAPGRVTSNAQMVYLSTRAAHTQTVLVDASFVTRTGAAPLGLSFHRMLANVRVDVPKSRQGLFTRRGETRVGFPMRGLPTKRGSASCAG